MKVKYIEIEANAEELEIRPTVMNSISQALNAMCEAIGNNYIRSCEADSTEEEQNEK